MKFTTGIVIVAIVVCAVGCAQIQRSKTAQAAEVEMVGMRRADVLSCMGPPVRKEADGPIEVWSYASGDGRVDMFSSGHFGAQSTTMVNGTATQIGNTALMSGTATGTTSGNTFSQSMLVRRSCSITVVFKNGVVGRVGYTGRAGGLLTPEEQCGYAVQNCVRGAQ